MPSSDKKDLVFGELGPSHQQLNSNIGKMVDTDTEGEEDENYQNEFGDDVSEASDNFVGEEFSDNEEYDQPEYRERAPAQKIDSLDESELKTVVLRFHGACSLNDLKKNGLLVLTPSPDSVKIMEQHKNALVSYPSIVDVAKNEFPLAMTTHAFKTVGNSNELERIDPEAVGFFQLPMFTTVGADHKLCNPTTAKRESIFESIRSEEDFRKGVSEIASKDRKGNVKKNSKGEDEKIVVIESHLPMGTVVSQIASTRMKIVQDGNFNFQMPKEDFESIVEQCKEAWERDTKRFVTFDNFKLAAKPEHYGNQTVPSESKPPQQQTVSSRLSRNRFQVKAMDSNMEEECVEKCAYSLIGQKELKVAADDEGISTSQIPLNQTYGFYINAKVHIIPEKTK